MTWKFTDERPVYLQIIEKIQDAVLSGELPPGSKLPPVRELAASARVNPNTMQHALQELERQQLLNAVSTSGRFITNDETIIQTTKQKRLQELTEICVKSFEALGVSPAQAAEYLRKYQERKD